jgi:hypothetical protein
MYQLRTEKLKSTETYTMSLSKYPIMCDRNYARHGLAGARTTAATTWVART